MTPMADMIPLPAAELRLVAATDTKERVAEKVMALEMLAEWVKAARADFEASLVEFIREQGPVQVGGILYWVGTAKKPPRCVDVPAAVEAVLTAVGGDFDAFCRHLASGALKYGACKATLPPERYAALFKVAEVEELMSGEAAAEKKLMKGDPQFFRERIA